MLVWRPKANPGPSAREQAARSARQAVNAAQARFTRAYAQALRDHPMNEELKQAKATLARARVECDQTCQRVLAKAAESDPAFAEQRRKIARLERALDAAKSTAERSSVAAELMYARSRLTEMGAAVLNDDIDVTIARAGVLEASNKLKAIELQYQVVLRDDPNFVAAKNDLDAARARLLNP